MKLLIILLAIKVSVAQGLQQPDLITVFESSNGTQTATYQQTIAFYQKLADIYPQISLQSIGKTDSGLPLHLVTLNADNIQSFEQIRKNKSILLINNGIHPGESDGIDASMMLFRDIASGTLNMPKNTVIVTIPIYNIGGSLNRNSTTRTNQNGPLEYGFRGNARNYDLNRDFIKNDSYNAQTFTKIFHLIQPDVFIDNHVSNGADYQYTLTHLFTQHNKLGGQLGDYLHSVLMPNLENKLKNKNWDITPYVNVFNQVPEAGFSQFMDYGRYSTGYTSLFNVLGMMVETHMLKPYKQRVEGTYQLMQSMIEIIDKDSDTIKKIRHDYYKNIYAQTKYTLDWKIDEDNYSILHFKGYRAQKIDSNVTHTQRLKYDRNRPFDQEVKYHNYFKPSLEVSMAKAYIIPQAWHKVIALLKLNNIQMDPLDKDKTITVQSYKISDYETRKAPYEGHYLHFNTQINSSTIDMAFKKGDYVIKLNQPAIKYIIETLEPQAPDSFFNWNFFDTILQQKEHFSPYVFEDMAAELLKSNPQLQKEFKQKQQSDEEFGKNWYAQLDWLHKHSKHYEQAHMQYPVYRLLK
ncbi:MAG: hypothetical protein JKY19_16160 [Alcanivoracaceae bacterium]|nr:hypothetical protein [Alcanivoracaceae bacterium]